MGIVSILFTDKLYLQDHKVSYYSFVIQSKLKFHSTKDQSTTQHIPLQYIIFPSLLIYTISFTSINHHLRGFTAPETEPHHSCLLQAGKLLEEDASEAEAMFSYLLHTTPFLSKHKQKRPWTSSTYVSNLVSKPGPILIQCLFWILAKKLRAEK